MMFMPTSYKTNMFAAKFAFKWLSAVRVEELLNIIQNNFKPYLSMVAILAFSK